MKELIQVQQNLSVPKSRKQQNYSYRSIDDILEAVKKVMPEGCFITLTDDVRAIGPYVYVSAVAVFSNGTDKVHSSGFAKEPEKIAAMSAPQITGSCSSYARKSALCGLLMIDDNKDVDSLSPMESGQSSKAEPATSAQIDQLKALSVGMETTNPKGSAFIDGKIKSGITKQEAQKLIDRGNK